jgi:hypothetical protein
MNQGIGDTQRMYIAAAAASLAKNARLGNPLAAKIPNEGKIDGFLSYFVSVKVMLLLPAGRILLFCPASVVHWYYG